MKTSLILIVALVFNTVLLVAGPLSMLIKAVDPLVIIAFEGILVLGYLFYKWFRRLDKASKIDFGYQTFFVLKPYKE